MKRYVLGFIFSDDLKTVYLIRKERPEWQKGRLNGVGGKVEAPETNLEAMSRECNEETGINIKQYDWRTLSHLKSNDPENPWEMFVFYTRLNPDQKKPATMTDEKIEAVPVSDLVNIYKHTVVNDDIIFFINKAIVNYRLSDQGSENERSNL